MPSPRQARYKIQDLLDHGEQPNRPLPDDIFDAIAEGILNRQGQILIPVVLSNRGRLIDGHNRLLAAQRAGKTHISFTEYVIDKNATDSESEALAAISYQRNRRQNSMEDNAHYARYLMRRFGWSQGTVAEKMKVSPAAVSQWLTKFPDTSGETPTTRTGKDGKTYDVTSVATPESAKSMIKPGTHPWQGDGTVLRSLIRLTSILQDMVADGGRADLPLPSKKDLGEAHFDICKMALTEQVKAIQAVLAEMSKPAPAPTKKAARPLSLDMRP